MPVIGDLVPSWAVARHRYDDVPGEPADVLFPEEAARMARAVPQRQREFASVRVCARAALERLGVAPVPLLPDRRGAPQWPAGVVGGMTHCDGYRAAVVARTGDAASIGVDAEPDRPLPEGILEAVALPAERRMVAELASRRPGVHWGRLLFSAKESVFKTWYPLTRRSLEFEEAELTVSPDTGTFRARLLVPGPVVAGRRVEVLDGRWAAGSGLLVTAIALPAR
ncbi:4'-phosphopantetheinyl transferase [Streptomyces sp. NPDC093094]|uniref:4'-phosphopantetheinyl transferase family protein n=1 Tax=Streptomyces sp. NPDC093094 TaxID=3366026 RepID=UPI0037F757CB